MQTKEEKRKKTKKEIKLPVRDLKPSKDAKGGRGGGGGGGDIKMKFNIPPGLNTLRSNLQTPRGVDLISDARRFGRLANQFAKLIRNLKKSGGQRET